MSHGLLAADRMHQLNSRIHTYVHTHFSMYEHFRRLTVDHTKYDFANFDFFFLKIRFFVAEESVECL